MALNLPTLPRGLPLVEKSLGPSFQFQAWWQSFVRALVAQDEATTQLIADLAGVVAQQQDQLDAIIAAQAAADAANAAAAASNAAAAVAAEEAENAAAAVAAANAAIEGLDIRVTALETP